MGFFLETIGRAVPSALIGLLLRLFEPTSANAGVADIENFNSPSKRRLPRIAALMPFLPFDAVAFLSVEQIMEQIHGVDPQIGGLPSICCAPGTGATQGRRRPTQSCVS